MLGETVTVSAGRDSYCDCGEITELLVLEEKVTVTAGRDRYC